MLGSHTAEGYNIDLLERAGILEAKTWIDL